MAVTSFINTNRLRHRVLTDIHLREGVKRASSAAPPHRPTAEREAYFPRVSNRYTVQPARIENGQ